MKRGANRGANKGRFRGTNAGKNKGLFHGTNSGFNIRKDLAPYFQEFTPATWSRQSFNFVTGNSQLFTGDATATASINSAIVGVNAKCTVFIWVKRTAIGATQDLFCRDNSGGIRIFNFLYTSANKFQFNFWSAIPASNNIVWVSTNSYTETREHNLWVIVLDWSATGTAKIEGVYLNPITGQTATPEAGTPTLNGTFASPINDSTVNANIGGRTSVANYSTSIINQVGILNTNLTADQVGLIHNNRVPFDIRTNTTLNANLVFYMVADKNSSFSSNWTWTDLIGGGIFTSSNMGASDLVDDAPALKQVSILIGAGQSNIVTRNKMPMLPSRFKAELEWLQFWNVNTFENANFIKNNNQYIDPANEFGWEYFLGELLNQEYRKMVRIFKVADGGTFLGYNGNSTNWRYPDGSQGSGGAMYQQLHDNDIPNLKEWELSNGYTVTKIPFLWGQGEADSTIQALALAYGVNEEAFLNHASYGMFTLLKQLFHLQPFFYDWLPSRTQTSPTLVYKDDVTAGKLSVEVAHPEYVRAISNDTSPTFDSVHFDVLGQELNSINTFKFIKIDGF